MSDTYTQLLISYIHDTQWRLKQTEKDTLEQLTQLIPMSNEQKLDLADQLAALRSRCCSECFALGIQIGLRITQEFGSFSATAS